VVFSIKLLFSESFWKLENEVASFPKYIHKAMRMQKRTFITMFHVDVKPFGPM